MAHTPGLPGLTVAEQAALTSGSDFWHSTPIESAGLPAITLTDGPHGVRLQADRDDMLTGRPATCFPPAVATASTWDPELLRRMGEALGDECRAMDVAVLLGPGINLKRSPLGGRDFEYFSEDPLLTGVLAAEWVRGLQSRGVGASLKHFAVNSQETDRMRVSADVDERTLREMYLRAFERVVTQAQPWTVMCAYNKVNGVYASQNHWLLTEVLRGEWGFEGVVVSDWGAVADRCAAVAAGLDLTMPGPADAGDRELVEAVRDGRLDPALLQTAADRVRALVDRAAARPSGDYDAEAHHELAREIAGRAIVLLKNDGALLPLPTSDGTQSIAVIGEFARTPRYQGGGSSLITPTRLDDALTEITAATQATVSFSPGYLTSDTAAQEGVTEDEAAEDEDLLAEAVALAQASDVAVVFVGSLGETEGADQDGDRPARRAPGADRTRRRRQPAHGGGALQRRRARHEPLGGQRPGDLGRAGCSGRPAAARSPTCCSGGSTRPAGWPRRSRSSWPTTPPTWTSPARTGTCATARASTSATAASTHASRRWPTRSASASPTPPSSTARRARSPPSTASRCASRSPTPAAGTGARSSRST